MLNIVTLNDRITDFEDFMTNIKIIQEMENKIPNNKKPNKVLIPKDELKAQIKVLWKRLGVTSKFQEIFKNHYIKVPILYRDDYLRYEIDRLKNFDVFIKKIKKDIII